jgi:hypothetical protein
MYKVQLVGKQCDGKCAVGSQILEILQRFLWVFEGLFVCYGVHDDTSVGPLHLLQWERRVSLWTSDEMLVTFTSGSVRFRHLLTRFKSNGFNEGHKSRICFDLRNLGLF